MTLQRTELRRLTKTAAIEYFEAAPGTIFPRIYGRRNVTTAPLIVEITILDFASPDHYRLVADLNNGKEIGVFDLTGQYIPAVVI